MGDRIHLVFDPDGSEEVHLEPEAPNGRASSRRHVATYGDSPRRAISHRRLLTVLRNLALAPQFGRSSVEICADGFPVLPANKFFVPFKELAGADYRGQKRGYWGTIISARTRGSDDALWLNTGTPDEPSIMVPNLEIRPLLKCLPGLAPEDLAGSHMLALGAYAVSRSGKKLIKVTRASEIAVLLPQ